MLAMEPAEPSIMERPPRRRGKRLFGRMVAWHCVYVCTLIVICVEAVFIFSMGRTSEADAGCIYKSMWAPKANCKSTCSPWTDYTDDASLRPDPLAPDSKIDMLPRIPDGCAENCLDGHRFMYQNKKEYFNQTWFDTIQPEDSSRRGSQRLATSSRRAKLPPQCNKVKVARAGAFNMLVFGEIAYALNCRYLDQTSWTMKQFTENKWAWVAIALTTVLQVFLTYTPGVQDVFSNAPIDGVIWAMIAGLSMALFILIDIEKTYGPKIIMPILRGWGWFLPTPLEEGFEQEKKHGDMWHLATNASVTGLPSSRPHSRNASRDNLPHGMSHPVSSYRPDDAIKDRLNNPGSFNRRPSNSSDKGAGRV